MQTNIIYILIIIFANTIGSVSGMGGGIIIKPAFDFYGADTLNNINFFSSVAVLTMSIVSIYKQIKGGIRINFQAALYLAFGSVLGGIVGNSVLNTAIQLIGDNDTVAISQISLTLILLIGILVNNYLPHGNLTLRTKTPYFLTGLILGTVSSILSIGGGPLNTALLIFMFSFSIKNANVYSLIIIFFSQLANLSTLAWTTNGFQGYKIDMLVYIVPAAAIGGLIGSALAKKLSSAVIQKLFVIIIFGIIALNIYNLLSLI